MNQEKAYLRFDWFPRWVWLRIPVRVHEWLLSRLPPPDVKRSTAEGPDTP